MLTELRSFRHSSLEYPESSGVAERHVQTMKDLFSKPRDSGQDPYLAMLEIRNTPFNGITALSQLKYGRALWPVLPYNQQRSKIKTRAKNVKYRERRKLT